MPQDHQATVTGNQDHGAAYRLELHAPALCAALKPGQFLMVRVPAAGMDPLLRRPLGYLSRDEGSGRLSLLVRRAGRGTDILSRVEQGGKLSLLGPLGNGWTLPAAGPVLLIAGGIGVVPLVDLAAALAPMMKTVMIYGARCGEELYAREELSRLPLELDLTTDDGSCGACGTTADALGRLDLTCFRAYYACGPKAMLACVQGIMAAAGVPGELSLEERMACGFGVCVGCVTAVRGPDGKRLHKRVCADGPVFSAAEVIFDD